MDWDTYIQFTREDLLEDLSKSDLEEILYMYDISLPNEKTKAALIKKILSNLPRPIIENRWNENITATKYGLLAQYSVNNLIKIYNEENIELPKEELSQINVKNKKELLEERKIILAVDLTENLVLPVILKHAKKDDLTFDFKNLNRIFDNETDDERQLTEKDSKRKPTKAQQNDILYKQQYKCHYCKKFMDPRQIEFHHLIPWAEGGLTTVKNVVAMDASCHKILEHENKFR